MEDQINKFLRDFKLVDEDTLKELESSTFQVSPIFSKNQDKIILSFVLGKSLPPQAYFFAHEQIKKNKQINVDWKLEIKEPNYSKKEVLEYFLYYFQKINPDLQSLTKNFKRDDFCTIKDKKITLEFDNDLEKDLFDTNLDSLQKIFHAAGFIDIFIDSTLTVKKKVIEQHRQELEKKIKTPKKVATKTIYNQAEVLQKNQIRAKTIVKLADLTKSEPSVIVYGEIIDIEKINAKKKFYEFLVTDYSDSLTFTIFFNDQLPEDYVQTFKIGDWVKLEACVDFSKYKKNELTGSVEKIILADIPKDYLRKDDAKKKRIEMAFHSNMTAFDGICDAENYGEFLEKMNYEYAAITDTSSVQAYPKIVSKIKETKIIYGLDCEVIPDQIEIVVNSTDLKMEDATYVIFDLETTGLYSAYHEIIEFGAVKVKKNQIIDTINFFIKPKNPIPENISSFTKITNADVANAISIKAALKKITEWVKDCVLVAHNGIEFDFKFLETKLQQNKMPLLKNPMLDTLRLSWAINPKFNSHSLGSIARKYNVEYNQDEAHRADFDAQVLKNVYMQMQHYLRENKIINLNQLNASLQNASLKEHFRGHKTLIYAKNQKGVKSIYNLLSESLTTGFFDRPKIFQSKLDDQRENLLVAASPGEGLLINTAFSSSDENLQKVINLYDFVLIVPPSWFDHLHQNQLLDEKFIQDATARIIHLAKNKLVIASSDAYYLHPHQHVYYHLMTHVKALGGKRHRFYRIKSKEQFAPHAHFRTTGEMEVEFKFLKDKKLVQDIVINNAYSLIKKAFSKEKIEPGKKGLFFPKIANADKNLTDLAWQTAREWYGKKLPDLIQERIQYELDAIIKNGYGIVYWIAHLLVTKSNQNGYLVGSRGSVGSSLVATLTGISEINPLPPHYWCKKCHFVEFKNDVDDGFDLKIKKCSCGEKLIGEGHNIPFATFMGFEGNKVPDIDLNFSGEYQLQAHQHVRELFGSDHALRVGTVATIAKKTAYGYVRTFFEETNKIETVKNAEINRYAKNITGVKRTTGQHPGGIIVFPKEFEITDFTPYNFPADDLDSDWKTTHFTYEDLHDNLLKFDLLGHDDPTMLEMLRDLTGIDPIDIPHHDEKVMSLFNSLSSLKISAQAFMNESTGVIGIPEFGTELVRKMLQETKPKTFADLIRISGLSHGKDVWQNNAQSLVNKGLSLNQIIACRDDIMEYLTKQGLKDSDAFKIMERVRKGLGLTDEMVHQMQEKNVKPWYIESCQKIKYMFPKAHAAAYVLMAWRIAWYKIYYPLQYYATLYSIKLIKDHDTKTCVQGTGAIREALKNLKERLTDKKTASELKEKEKNLITTYESYLEMSLRGYKMGLISLEHSLARKFRIVNNEIIPPFITIDGLGEVVADSIIQAREQQMFTSIKDFADRTKVTKTHLAALKASDIFVSLKEDDQIKLF